MPLPPRAARIAAIAQETVNVADVFRPRGQGHGNFATNDVVAAINARVAAELGDGIAQCVLGSGNKQSVDFFLPDEETVVEIEFSLSNPYPCLEKDLFKVLLAKDAGVKVTRLVRIGDPGSTKRLRAPAPRAIIDYAARTLGVAVEVVELKPPPSQVADV